MNRILVPGETCWRIEPADNLACIVDAADYFHHAKSAMLQAEKRIMLIGWDFDTRIKLEPGKQTLDGPNRLGMFLRWLVREKPDLEILVLKWNIGAFTAIGRGMTPVFVSNWLTDERLRFEIDGAHPVGAAHHQKIIVIDDALAFCGGIDMTVDRWDTSDHVDRNDYRITPSGRRYGPWHDATTAVDGNAAAAIGELARARWKSATGEDLTPVESTATPWPVNLAPTLRVVDVAVARTLPELGERTEVREIEALYLAAIAGAEHTLYIESQYLASRTLAEAIAARLREDDGPEIVLVIPRNADGWLEQKAMDGARHDLLHLLWSADIHDRFGAFYPVTSSGAPIYVHAKVLVMDDRLLRNRVVESQQPFDGLRHRVRHRRRIRRRRRCRVARLDHRIEAPPTQRAPRRHRGRSRRRVGRAVTVVDGSRSRDLRRSQSARIRPEHSRRRRPRAR